MSGKPDVTVIGAAIMDVPAGPVELADLEKRSHPVERIELGFGGDALNEAVALGRLGHAARLVAPLGRDAAGEMVLGHCRANGVDTAYMQQEEGLRTGVNLVLVDGRGERRFITAKNSSLRALRPAHIRRDAWREARLVSFASIFVFPHMGVGELAALLRQVKEAGLPLCADMTRHKNGERVEDMAPALRHVDWLFPNCEEAKAVTGATRPADMADAFHAVGVKNVVIKLGDAGCYFSGGGEAFVTGAFPVARCADTTGAGDCFAAGFISGLLRGLAARDCTRLACAAASVCVEHMGAVPPTLQKPEVLRRFACLRGPEEANLGG